MNTSLILEILDRWNKHWVQNKLLILCPDWLRIR
jgi:hypothetical protein